MVGLSGERWSTAWRSPAALGLLACQTRFGHIIRRLRANTLKPISAMAVRAGQQGKDTDWRQSTEIEPCRDYS